MIVHEWLEPLGGAEKVMEEIAALYPDSPIRCLWNDAPQRFESSRVTETWLARTPLRRHKALALPIMPEVWRHLGSSDAEWILSSSHLFAHHARFSGPARNAPKYVYAYTPARYIWEPDADVRGNSFGARAVSRPLRALDRRRAQEPKSIAAISEFVRERIKRDWGRDSIVIYPPVDIAAFADDAPGELTEGEQQILDSLPDTFVMGASRFIPYKRLDLVIQLGVAADVHVVLAGNGPSMGELRALADQHPGQVTFVDRPSLALLRELYRRALVYVFPPIEDFGIMPVEAMATGTPVIARSFGGAAETVVDGVTGALLPNFTETEMREAVDRVASIDPAACKAQADQFTRAAFHKGMTDWVGS
ncbi:glycosyltransferase family 4 protein [Subtercola sp. Z020]|nr:glycosyltransferase family 4 protein [Subtercola sp. Z020]